VVVVSGGQAPGMVSPVVAIVVVVVAATCHRAAVVVMVRKRVMTHILTRFLVPILDPGLTLKTISNREHNLLLSRLLLPY